MLKGKVIKRINISVSKGINAGKLAGEVITEEGEKPYYFCVKRYGYNQMWHKPKYRGILPLSCTIAERCYNLGVKNCIFQMVGYEKGSFFLVVPLKDLMNGRIIRFDDEQYYIDWAGYERVYDVRQIDTQREVLDYV